jgi:hypothetical protein
MHLNIPIISTLHGSITETIEDNITGILVPQRDPEALLEKISLLLQNEKIAENISQQGNIRASIYNNNNLNWEFLTFLKQVAQNKPYTIKPKNSIDLKTITENSKFYYQKDDVVLIIKIKNEAFRVPFFLHYYRLLGVTKFIFIDNGSTDNLLKILSEERDIFIFQTLDMLKNCHDWVNIIIQKYLQIGSWCLIIDTDEFFAYPLYERFNLRDFITYLEKNNHDAVSSMLLDMYSDKPVQKTIFNTEINPILVEKYFDKEKSITECRLAYCNYSGYQGGVRSRVFFIKPWITKFPLIKTNGSTHIHKGAHRFKAVNKNNETSVILHYKYDNMLYSKIKYAIKHKNYASESYEYSSYEKAFKENPDLSLWYEGSQEYKGIQSLVSAGIITVPDDYEAFFKQLPPTKETSVIICLKENKVPEALVEALNMQTYLDFELIVMYSDSKEFDVTNLSKIEHRIIQEKKSNFTTLRNKSIYTANGYFRVYLDSASIPKKSYLKNLINKVKKEDADIGIGVNKQAEKTFTNILITRKAFLMYGKFDGKNNSLSKDLTEYVEKVKGSEGKILFVKDAIVTGINRSGIFECLF